MPDGPSVEIRVTADTAGVDELTARLAGLKGDLGQVRSAMIEAGGTTDELRARAAALTSQIGQTRAQIAGLASAAKESEGALSSSRGGSEAAAGGLRSMESASRNLGVELKHGVALIDEFARGAHGAMISSLVAAARDSGYLGTAVAALKGPFGIALAGSAALAAGLYVLIERAHATETALRGVYNASLLMGGVSAGHAEVGAQAAMTALGSQNVMGPGSIDKFVEKVYTLGDASDSAKQKLITLGPALYSALDKDDKALEKYVEHFRDTSSLKSFAEAQGLITEAQAAGFDVAVQAKDADGARAMVLDTLTKRLSGATAAIDANARIYGRGLHVPLPERLPETPAGARPQDIQQIIEFQNKYNRVANETAVIEQNIAAMTKLRAAASTDASRAQYDTMIKTAREQEEALRVTQAKKDAGPGGQPSASEQLRARMAEAENAAAVQAAALHKNLRQAELQADVQVMQQELATAKLTNTQRLQLEADLLRKKDELMAADLRGAGGGRSAKGPSALSRRGGGPEARSQYEDFAAGEREKIAAAAGSGAQIQAIYQEWAARAKAQFGDTSREYQNVMRAMTEATTREAATQAREIAAASRAAYEQFAGAERDKIAAAQGATSQSLAIYQEWADRAKAVFGAQSTQYEAVVRQMTEAANRASEQMQAAFAKPFDSLGSSAERALTGLLTHQTTVGKAEQEAYRGLIGSSVDELGTALNKTLASSLFGSGTKSLGEGLVGMLGVGKPGGLFGTGLGAVTGETTETTLATAVTANTAAVTANTAALTTSAGAAVSGGALSGAGGIASGAGSFLGSLPLIGSLFGGGGAADQDFSGGVGIGGGGLFAGLGALFGFKGGGIMPRTTGAIMPMTTFRLPSYAAGGFAVPGLAKLHENEMVLPAHVSNFVQNAAAAASGGGHSGASGDTHLHFHGPADGPAIERFLTPFIRRAVPGAVQNAFRSNALTPRTV